MASKRFLGKVALVTGAGRGMGKATAMTLAREGAAVVVNDVNMDWAEDVRGEIEEAGGRAIAHAADVSKEDQVQAMINVTVEKYGTVDILINNAGILRSTTPLEEIPLEEWDLMMGVNICGVFLCTKAGTVVELPYSHPTRVSGLD